MIVFAHGLEGSPGGSKVRSLRAAGFEVAAPDFTGMNLAARVELLDRSTRGIRCVLAGSSYGGLTAAIVASRHPERFTGLMLLAPAFNLAEEPEPDVTRIRAPEGIRTIVIHGTLDDVVPVLVSRAYRDRSCGRVGLIEVEDVHRLGNSHGLIVHCARALDAP